MVPGLKVVLRGLRDLAQLAVRLYRKWANNMRRAQSCRREGQNPRINSFMRKLHIEKEILGSSVVGTPRSRKKKTEQRIKTAPAKEIGTLLTLLTLK